MDRVSPGAIPAGAGHWTYLIPLIVVGLVILRNSRARTLRAAEATDSFLLLAVDVVSAQRLEWWIRARRMIAEAKAA